MRENMAADRPASPPPELADSASPDAHAPRGDAESESLLRPGDEEGVRTHPPLPQGDAGDDRAPLEPNDVVLWAAAIGARVEHCAPSGSCSEVVHGVRWFLEFGQLAFAAEGGLLGTICWVFIMFSARIFVTPLWTWTFIPVLSPLYGHGPGWAETTVRQTAILCHVFCGMGMLACATMQFDQQMRKSSARMHRASGYLYVVFGVGCVAALQPLRAVTAKDHGYGVCVCRLGGRS